MARRSAATLLAAVFATAAVWHLSSLAVGFVAPPHAPGQLQGAAGAAALGGALAVAPQPAHALAEITYDGWGPAEITAVLIPIVFVTALYLEWEGKQSQEDDIGVGTLGQQNDGGAYFRRSPESG